MSLKPPLIRIMLVLSLLGLTGAAAWAQEPGTDYDALLIKVMEEYQTLVNIPLDSDVEDRSALSWHVVGQAIQKGFLRFTVNPTPSPDLLEGARFLAEPGSNVTYIVFTRNLLDSWETHPSLVYTLTAGAVHDARIFFSDPQAWGIARSNAMERLLVKADLYRAQAEFVRDRMIPSGYLPAPYEAFLVDSLDNDNMASAVIYLEMHSLAVTEAFYQAWLAYENNGDDEALRQALLESGKNLLAARNALPDEADDKTVLPVAVTIHTWLEFTPEMISRIYNKDRPENPLSFGEVLEQETDYAETRRQLEARRTGDILMMQHIAEETHRGFSRLE